MDEFRETTLDADIALFVEEQLTNDIKIILEKKYPNRRWRELLVAAAGHLFQWIATACLAMVLISAGQDLVELFESLVNKGGGLDGIYTDILQQKLDHNNEKVMTRFRRLFGSILAAQDPLSITSHSKLCPDDEGEEFAVGTLSTVYEKVHEEAHR